MDEQTIADSLRSNVPESASHDMAAPVVGDPNLTQIEYPLDELTQYKLHQQFGENYKEGDDVAKQQLAYIYSDIAQRIHTSDYTFVVAKMNELRRMLGLNHDENARYKLYQWLKLDQKRSKIEMEMRNATFR